jgi:hypothetical protein
MMNRVRQLELNGNHRDDGTKLNSNELCGGAPVAEKGSYTVEIVNISFAEMEKEVDLLHNCQDVLPAIPILRRRFSVDQ